VYVVSQVKVDGAAEDVVWLDAVEDVVSCDDDDVPVELLVVEVAIDDDVDDEDVVGGVETDVLVVLRTDDAVLVVETVDVPDLVAA